MSNTLIATLGGLCALFFWGAGDWLIARGSRRGSALEVNAAFQLPGVLITSLLVLAARPRINNMHNIWILSLAGLIFSGAFIFFIKAYSKGSTGLVTPAACSYPLFTLLLTAIFLTLNFSHQQIIAMLVVIAGVMLLAYEKRAKGVSLRIQHQATLLAILTAFMWGAGNVIQNTVVAKESWQTIIWVINISTGLIAFLLFLVATDGGARQKLKTFKSNRTALIAGAIYSFGSFGFYYSSVRVGSILIPLVVSSASPLFTSALGAAYDNERLGVLKRVGAVVVVGGIILLNAA